MPGHGAGTDRARPPGKGGHVHRDPRAARRPGGRGAVRHGHRRDAGGRPPDGPGGGLRSRRGGPGPGGGAGVPADPEGRPLRDPLLRPQGRAGREVEHARGQSEGEGE